MISAYFYKLLSFFDRSYIVPRRINLETSSLCQLRCPSCPTTTKDIDPVVGKGFLNIEDFKNLVHKNPYLKIIELSNYGEIFLNPYITQIMEYADKKQITLTANNGVNLNNVSNEVLESLVKFRFRSMCCSIDGASQEIYEKYRVRGSFDTVVKNINKINYFKARYNSVYPELTWQFIAFSHNEHEIEKAKNLAHSLDMKFSIKLSWDPELSEIKNKESIKENTGLDVSSREEYIDKYKKDYKENICKQLWKSPQINWDGKLLGCCRNFWGDFGENAFEKGLLNSVNNKKIRHARRMLQGKEKPGKDIPCSSCDIYINRKKYRNWIQN